MDVTSQYLQTVLSYNSSDSTDPGGLSPSTRLNYASGPTYAEAVEQNVYMLPYTLSYDSDLGIQGIENIYVKVNHLPETIASDICIEEQYWECFAVWDTAEPELLYEGAEFNVADEGDLPTYQQVQISNKAWFGELSNVYMKVRLDNVGTGNIYADTNIETALYNKSKVPSQYEEMYVPLNGSTTFGIHSRNSKRTSMLVQLTLGTDIKRRSDMTEDDLKLLSTPV